MEIIREANIEDIERGLLTVYIEGYRFHQNGRPDIFKDFTDSELKERLIEDFNRLVFLVLVLDDEVIGYSAIEIKERFTKKLNIDQFVILEKYRGKNYGRKLIDYTKKYAKDKQCERIELNCWMFNTGGLEFYEHTDFKRQRIIYEMDL